MMHLRLITISVVLGLSLLIGLLGLFNPLTSSADKLRLHVDENIYIDVPMNSDLKTEIRKMHSVKDHSTASIQEKILKKQITQEVYKKSVNIPEKKTGHTFRVRNGRIVILNEKRNQRESLFMPTFSQNISLSDMAQQGDVLVGDDAATDVHLKQVRPDSHIKQSASTTLDNTLSTEEQDELSALSTLDNTFLESEPEKRIQMSMQSQPNSGTSKPQVYIKGDYLQDHWQTNTLGDAPLPTENYMLK